MIFTHLAAQHLLKKEPRKTNYFEVAKRRQVAAQYHFDQLLKEIRAHKAD